VVVFDDRAESGFVFAPTDYLAAPCADDRLEAILNRYRGTKAEPRVLIIDNTADQREMISQGAARRGWAVSQCDEVLAAFKQLATDRPDLILLDLYMNDIDAFEVVRLLRKTQAGRAIPVVLLVPKTPTDEEAQGMKAAMENALARSAR